MDQVIDDAKAPSNAAMPGAQSEAMPPPIRRYAELSGAPSPDPEAVATALKEAKPVQPDASELRKAKPSDVRVGALLWYRRYGKPGAADGHGWSLVRKVTNASMGWFVDHEGSDIRCLDEWLIEQRP